MCASLNPPPTTVRPFLLADYSTRPIGVVRGWTAPAAMTSRRVTDRT